MLDERRTRTPSSGFALICFAGTQEDFRDFEQVARKAQMACFNSGQRVEDHFGDITEMVEKSDSPATTT